MTRFRNYKIVYIIVIMESVPGIALSFSTQVYIEI